MTEPASPSRASIVPLALWILGLFAVAAALWSEIGNPLEPWRRLSATGLLAVAVVGSLAWFVGARRWRSWRAHLLMAIASLVPAIVIWPLLQSPHGEHLVKTYFHARRMAAELESAVADDFDSYRPGEFDNYRGWRRQWDAFRAQYEAWFPSVGERLASAERRWGQEFARWIEQRIDSDSRKALDELARTQTLLDDAPVALYVDWTVPNVRQKIIRKFEGELTPRALSRPQQALDEIDGVENAFQNTVVSESLGEKLNLLRSTAERAWADAEIQRLMALARHDPGAALLQLEAISTRIANPAVVKRIAPRIPAVRDVAEFGKTLGDLRGTSQLLISQGRYQDALAGVQHARDELQAKAAALGLREQLEKLVDETAFVEELRRLATQEVERSPGKD